MQIFDRISRIFKSNISENFNTKTYFENEDDELKRIIDELNSGKSEKKSKVEDNANHNSNSSSLSELDKAYHALGVSRSSSNDEIKATYKKKMKEFHPDKVSRQNDDVRKKAEIRSKEINAAYTIIRKARAF